MCKYRLQFLTWPYIRIIVNKIALVYITNTKYLLLHLSYTPRNPLCRYLTVKTNDYNHYFKKHAETLIRLLRSYNTLVRVRCPKTDLTKRVTFSNESLYAGSDTSRVNILLANVTTTKIDVYNNVVARSHE